MLFESQSKADNFIKFNHDEIAEKTGRAPSRSYYCSFCCGWHLTSIADTDVASDRDERDARVWEQLRTAIAPKKKKKQAVEPAPAPKKRRIPRTEDGYKIRVIADSIDRIILKVDSALFKADVHKLRVRFESLLNLEKELRSKSAELGIDVGDVDRRYAKIAKTKQLFSRVFDYFVDRDKRLLYLSSVSEEEKSKREYIIINNIEIIDRINTCFERIDLLSDVSNQDEIRELCNNIIVNHIPQLKYGTCRIKQYFKYEAEKILSGLTMM